jgi:hypothetical protein
MRLISPFAGTALALLFFVACSGGGGTGGGALSAGIQPPTQFAAKQSDNYYQVLLTWTASPSTIDGYDLSGAVGSGPYSQIGTGLIPSDVIGGLLTLDPTTPEDTNFQFRICAQQGTNRSDYAQTSYHLGIYPATMFVGDVDPRQQQINLTWVRNSVIADAVVLQRAVGSNPASLDYSTLPMADLTATSYVDTDIQDGNVYNYQIYYRKGSEASSAATCLNVYYSLASPGNLAVATGTSSATLTWVPRSTQATELRVYRKAGFLGVSAGDTPIATLPPTSTTYTDQGLAQGIYSYCVASYDNKNGNLQMSPMVPAIMQPSALGSSTFQADFQLLPSAPWLQQDASGNWLAWPVLQTDRSYGLLTWTNGSSSCQEFGAVDLTSTPGILMDTSFQPHLAFDLEPAGTSESLVHGWRDNAGWHSEVVEQGRCYSTLVRSDFTFLQAPDGTLHLLYGALPGSSGTLHGVDAVRGPGGWTLTEDPQLFAFEKFALDSTGNLLAVKVDISPGASSSTLELWTRAADGSWSSEAIPEVVVPAAEDSSLIQFQVGSDGTIHLITDVSSDYPGGPGTVYLARRSGVWSSPEWIAPTSPAITVDTRQMTICPSNQSIYFAENLSQGLVLFNRPPAGSWQSVLLVPAGPYQLPFWQGLSAAGKFYLATRPPESPTGAAVIFTEQ